MRLSRQEDGVSAHAARLTVRQAAGVRALAHVYVLVAVSGEIPSGVIELAQRQLDSLIRKCAAPIVFSPLQQQQQQQLVQAQQRSLADVVKELLRQLSSAIGFVRSEQCVTIGVKKCVAFYDCFFIII